MISKAAIVSIILGGATMMLSGVAVAQPPSQGGGGNTILSIATATNGLSTLLDLMTEEDLVYVIDGSSGTNVTVFAPTDEAFAALTPGDRADRVVNQLAWGAHLRNLLQNHLVVSLVPLSSITTTTTTVVETLAGEMITVSSVGGNNFTVGNNGANVIMPDVVADNGIVHVIDRVLTPTWWDQSLVSAAHSEDYNLSTLLGLLETAGLVAPLSSSNGTFFTIFAPTNDAFGALDDATLGCVTSNLTILTSVLTYHVVGDVLPAARVMPGQVVTLEGSVITLDVAGAGKITINGGANITKADALLANNGILHYLDAVLVPDAIAPLVAACVESATRAPTLSPVATPPATSRAVVVAVGRGTATATAVVAWSIWWVLG
jgi:transforming growth factor-beta-induced protein